MVHEAGQLSYFEKVKLGFEKFGTVKGEESRDIEGTTYQFSLAPSSKEEQLARWHFYIERKSEIEYNKRIANYESQIESALEPKQAINSIIEEIENTYFKTKENPLKNYPNIPGINIMVPNYIYVGMECLKLGKPLNSYFQSSGEPTEVINILNDDKGWFNKLAIGQALYKIQLKLKDELKELEEDSEKSNSDEWNYRNKLALLHVIGVINYLKGEHNLGNENKKFAELLKPILGESNPNEIGKLLNDDSKSPLNPKAMERIKKHLSNLGLSANLHSESTKKKK